jgi:hypothetical protein
MPEESTHFIKIIDYAVFVANKFELTNMLDLRAKKVEVLRVKNVEFFPSEPYI